MNELPDELILKIFSSLPMFKRTVATHLISKAWKYPWKLEPDIKFDDDDESYESFVTFMSFIYGSLLFNNAQILERLSLGETIRLQRSIFGLKSRLIDL